MDVSEGDHFLGSGSARKKPTATWLRARLRFIIAHLLLLALKFRRCRDIRTGILGTQHAELCASVQ